jgi:hypothetical protein
MVLGYMSEATRAGWRGREAEKGSWILRALVGSAMKEKKG